MARLAAMFETRVEVPALARPSQAPAAVEAAGQVRWLKRAQGVVEEGEGVARAGDVCRIVSRRS